eukprot:GILK01002995.1.p1 GENE.GILK01002995.1~~GILK01002995.1.p1  ORF type:complete len:820 (+),score=133.43 GILK01002995.1:42-2462(+)
MKDGSPRECQLRDSEMTSMYGSRSGSQNSQLMESKFYRQYSTRSQIAEEEAMDAQITSSLYDIFRMLSEDPPLMADFLDMLKGLGVYEPAFTSHHEKSDWYYQNFIRLYQKKQFKRILPPLKATVCHLPACVDPKRPRISLGKKKKKMMKRRVRECASVRADSPSLLARRASMTRGFVNRLKKDPPATDEEEEDGCREMPIGFFRPTLGTRWFRRNFMNEPPADTEVRPRGSGVCNMTEALSQMSTRAAAAAEKVQDSAKKIQEVFTEYELLKLQEKFKEISNATDLSYHNVAVTRAQFRTVLVGLMPTELVDSALSLFQVPVRFNFRQYVEMTRILFKSKPKDEIQICFWIYDINGDDVICARDLFTLIKCDSAANELDNDFHLLSSLIQEAEKHTSKAVVSSAMFVDAFSKLDSTPQLFQELKRAWSGLQDKPKSRDRRAATLNFGNLATVLNTQKVSKKLVHAMNQRRSAAKPSTLEGQFRNEFEAVEIACLTEVFHTMTENGTVLREMQMCTHSGLVFGVRNDVLGAHLFHIMDEDQQGSVYLPRFLEVLRPICRGTYDDRTAFAFSLYDVDGDGSISAADMDKVVEGNVEGNKMLKDEVYRMLDILIQRMIDFRNGDLSVQHFRVYFSTSQLPSILQVMQKTLLPEGKLESMKRFGGTDRSGNGQESLAEHGRLYKKPSVVITTNPLPLHAGNKSRTRGRLSISKPPSPSPTNARVTPAPSKTQSPTSLSLNLPSHGSSWGPGAVPSSPANASFRPSRPNSSCRQPSPKTMSIHLAGKLRHMSDAAEPLSPFSEEEPSSPH